MKVAIVGTGRVGAALAFCLVSNKKISELLLVNRTRSTAEGIKADLAGTFPKEASNITIGDYKDVNDSDIIAITGGAFGAPAGSSLWEENKKFIGELFRNVRPKNDAKIIVISTPVDKIAQLTREITGSEHVFGFGGQLDVNRLKYLLPKEEDVHFIGEHGGAGIPVFRQEVPDRETIIKNTKGFYGTFLAKYGASIHGTANELNILIDALLSDTESTLTISYYNEEHKLFLTWPCKVSKNGAEPIKVDLNEQEQMELDNLIKTRQNEE